jgi:hypothetical protein
MDSDNNKKNKKLFYSLVFCTGILMVLLFQIVGVQNNNNNKINNSTQF